MDQNANPNPEASTSIDAAPAYYAPAYVLPYTDPAYYAPAYVLPYTDPAYYPPAYDAPAYVLPYTDPAYYLPTYVPYAAAPVVATHDSPVGYNYAAVMPPTPAETELPTPTETELPTPTPAEVGNPRQYRSERLLFKVLRFTGKIVYIDLQKNRKGLFFQMKDLSASRRDYILLDLSGLDEFLTHLNHFVETNTKHFLETNKCTDFLFETRTMTDNKKMYTFTTLLEEECLILRIRMVEGSHDHSIAIPVDWSSDHGCAGWSQFGNKLLDVLIEYDIIFTDHLASTLERQRQLMSRLQLLLDHPGSSSHEPSRG